MTTFYCSSSGSSGDGSLGNPWGITEVVWGVSGVDDGDTLLLLNDGTYSGKMTGGNQGSAGSPITIDGQSALIDVASAENACIQLNGARRYFVIRNVRARLSTSSNIALQSSTSGGALTGTIVEHVASDNAARNGASMVRNNGQDPAITSGLVFRDIISVDDGQHGVAINGNTTGAVLSRSYASGSSADFSGWGLYSQPAGESINDATWSNVAGNVWETTTFLDAGDTVRFVIMGGKANGDPYWLAEAADFAAVGSNEWKQSGTDLRIDIGEDPNGVAGFVIHSDATATTIADGVSNAVSGAFDGTGIGCDQGHENCEILRCLSTNQPGAAFSFNGSRGNKFISDAAYGSDKGFQVFTSQTGTTQEVRQCSTNGQTNEGFHFQRLESGATILLTNSISNGGTYGARGQTIDGTVTDSYSCMFGASVANYSGVTKGTGSIEVDPQFRSATDLRLKRTSPCKATGTRWWPDGPPRGEDGLRHWNLPEMGAYAIREESGGLDVGGLVPGRMLGGGLDIGKLRAG